MGANQHAGAQSASQQEEEKRRIHGLCDPPQLTDSVGPEKCLWCRLHTPFRTIPKIVFMPMHEVLDHEVVVGKEHTRCSSDGESGVQEDFDRWK